jgi:hypothetical protein
VPHVLLVAPHLSSDSDALNRLLAALKAAPPRTAVALVLTGEDRGDRARWQPGVDAQGVLRIPELGVELLAQQIPAVEAAQLAHMLALAAATDDRPVPAAHGDRPWDAYADAAGGLRADMTTAQAAPTSPGRP